VTAIQRGDLAGQIDSMTRSQEFQQRVRSKTPAAWLDAFYKGLHGRTADTAGVRTYLPGVEQGRYADVLMDMIVSPEFEGRLPGPVNRRGPGTRGPDTRGFDPRGFDPRPPSIDPTRAMMACQDAVLDEIRSHGNRQLVLRFSAPEVLADSVRGRATDVLSGDRSLSYRCDMDRGRSTVNRVTATWDDGQEDAMFQVAVVRACQDAVRENYRRDGGRSTLVFESAGILPLGPNLESIRGNAREGSLFGSGRPLDYACEAQRGRITSATFKYGR
jgi:hypothetical protein